MTSIALRLLGSAALAAVVALPAGARAQQQPTEPRAAPAAQGQPQQGQTQQGQTQQGQQKAKQQGGAQGTGQARQGEAKGKSATVPPKEDVAQPRSGDAQLRQRIEQLEEQLADMQVLIGTLESLGRGSSASSASETFRGPSAASQGGGVDGARVDSLETQMRAMSDQIEQLSAQVRQLAGRRSEALPSAAPPPPAPAPTPETAARAARDEPSRSPGFGSITVTPNGADRERDPIGRIIAASPPPSATPAPSPASAPAALPPTAASAGTPKELYEVAYGYMLQQDYGSAEVVFEEFLRRYPSDRLSGDAQYWLGESLYVQRRYRPAGQAFLRVVEKHPQSGKVPNSILKLAQSLDQLGQKDCALFEELETRHPNAPNDVKSRARALKQRVGC